MKETPKLEKDSTKSMRHTTLSQVMLEEITMTHFHSVKLPH